MGAIVAGAIIAGAFIVGAIIAGAFIVGAIIAGAIIAGAIVAGAIVVGVNIVGAFVAEQLLRSNCRLHRSNCRRSNYRRSICRTFLQPHHCIVWQWAWWGFYPIHKTCRKWDMTLSSSMSVYSVMHDIYDSRRVPMERWWVALLIVICHMQIFKSIYFSTMGLWKWITFFFIRTVFWPKMTMWNPYLYANDAYEVYYMSQLFIIQICKWVIQ